MLTDIDKVKILDDLHIGICDIIYQYEREDDNSTKDEDIIPRSYKDLLQICAENGITELLFVYQNAYKWFLHSSIQQPPVKLRDIGSKYKIDKIGVQQEIPFNGKVIKCVVLPSPLNRGSKNQTLGVKLELYRQYITS